MNKENKWALFHEVVGLLAQGYDAIDIQQQHPETAPAIVRNTVTSVIAWQKRKAATQSGN
jgi:hypothetical protein